MTTPIEPEIKNYIDITTSIVREDFRRELGVATEEFQHRLKLMGETWEAKTRSVLREEMDIRFVPIEQKLDMVITEMRDINKRAGETNKGLDETNKRLDANTRQLDANLAAFQKQFGHHERRITRLEHKVA